MERATSIAVALLLSASLHADDLVPAAPLRQDGKSGVASLHLESATVVAGEWFRVEYLYRNTGEAARYYDPHFDLLIRPERPGSLLVYDNSGTLLGDLLSNDGFSSRVPADSDWVRLPRDGFVGHRWGFRTGPLPPKSVQTVELPVGVYQLQFVGNRRFTSEPRSLNDATGLAFATEPVTLHVVAEQPEDGLPTALAPPRALGSKFRAHLSSSKPRYRPDEPWTIEIRYDAFEQGRYFDLFLEQSERHARMCVFDSSGRMLGDLLGTGRLTGPGFRTEHHVPQNAILGFRREFDDPTGRPETAPGTYRVQLIVNDRLVRKAEATGREIMRSNVLEMVVE